VVGMVLAAGLDSASVLITFGLMQVGTGLTYRLPMPVQPLKAVAVIVITQQVAPGVLYGAGLAIGVIMLLLATLGLLDWLARVIPLPVIRGIQAGLGVQLAGLALRDYVMADQGAGLWLAGASFAIAVWLIGNRRIPAALPIVVLGVAYALVFKVDIASVTGGFGLRLPALRVPAPADVLTGLLLLALPQVPLSLGNSILATRQVISDFFPGVPVSIRRIGSTYGIMNLINPFLGGIPTCHGSGGLVGHYTFGGRTGGSVVMYGMLFLVLGLLFSGSFAEVVQVFPLPVLGVLLLFEAVGLMALSRDLTASRTEFTLAMLVAVTAAFLPYGYVVGLVAGTALVHLSRRGLTAVGQ
jgi:MFS superfamily sulfate permease-like transporter